MRDPLTGLLSRRALQEGLEHLAREAERRGTPFAVLILDLDQFKEINDTYGHEAGDAVIVAWSRFLRSFFRPSDRVIRFGGDEFVILLAHTSRNTARSLAFRLLEEASRREFAGFSMGASIGLAAFPVDSTDPYELLALADQALFEAKRRGRGRVETPERVDPHFVWPPPYVSRIQEERAFLRALEGKEPLILVRGPAGSGKSALVNRLVQNNAGSWLRVNAYARAAFLHPFRHLSPEGYTTQEAFSALCSRLRGGGLVVENLQWLDEASWQVLFLLISKGYRVVATVREEDLEEVVAIHLHQAYRMGWVQEVGVGPMGPAQMEFLLRGALQAQPPEKLLREVQDLSGGLPRLAGEILRELHEQGWLAVRRTWRYAGYPPDFRPARLEPLWTYRTNRLTSRGMQALGLLGLAGGRMSRDLLERAFAELMEGIRDELVDRHLVETGPVVFLREGIWGMFAVHELDPSTRASLARRVLEVLPESREEIRRVWLAHLARVPDLWQRVDAALDTMFQRSDAPAVRLLLRLVERFGRPPRDVERKLLEARALVLRQTGDPELEDFLEQHRHISPRIARIALDHRISRGDYRQALEEVKELLERFRDPEARIRFVLEQVWALINMGEVDQAMERLQPILRKIPRDSPDRGRALNFLGQIRRFQGSYRGAHRAFREALEVYRRLGDRRGEAAILTNWSLVLIDQDRFGEAEEYLTRALQLYATMDYPEGQVAAQGNLAMVYADMGHAERGIELLQEAMSLAEQMGFRRPLPFFYRLMSIFHRFRGDLDRAMGYARRSLEEARRQGIVRYELQALVQMARIHAARGDLENTRKILRLGERIAKRKGVSLRDTFWWVYEQLELALAQRDWEQLRGLFQKIQGIAEELNPSYRLYAYLSGARLAAVEGRREEAYAWLEKARRILTRLGSPMLNGVYALHRGEVELELGETDRGRSYLYRAREIFSNLGLSLWVHQASETLQEVEQAEE